MRRAASYAIDRRALTANGDLFSSAAAPAQMNIPPGMPGFRNRHIYPLTPDLTRARRLAGGGRRDAELLCVLQAPSLQAAQIIKNNLAAIGINVHIHCVPGYEMWTLLFRPNEPWDIAIEGGGSIYDDPGEYIGELPYGGSSHLFDPDLKRRIRAASRLSGPARARAYAGLDLTLTRDIVPRINYGNAINQDFVSARIGCQLYQPLYGIDLDALCIRKGGSSG